MVINPPRLRQLTTARTRDGATMVDTFCGGRTGSLRPSFARRGLATLTFALK